METKEDFISIVVAVVASVLLSWWTFYLWLPPVTLKSGEFWLYIMLVILILAIALTIAGYASGSEVAGGTSAVLFIIDGIILVLVLILALASSRLFNARAYSNILKVEKGEESLIPTSDGTNSIALMDTASAKILGNREMGSLSDVVSQYELDDYTQINYKNKPYKVSPLSYAGFFKWNNNKNEGVPGYVIVDPVTFEGKYVKLKKGMKYVPSAHFGEQLERKIRMEYPHEIFTNLHFEIDENGNPFYIATTVKHTIGVFGGTQVSGCIVVNPVDGTSKQYTDKIPNWIDVVYYGDLICSQYNNYAQLQNGFWNSVVGMKGCRKVTESEDSSSDFGYICKNNDVYIYTGVTSVTNDSSNLGFIIANERTGETKYIECPGADEFSAMKSAEGDVQEKRYQASFPSLINVDGTPTYIMVLKDNNGIVKLYACVNVGQYNQVATATSQKDCVAKYRMLIKGDISQEDAVNENVASDGGKSDVAEEKEDLSKFVDKEVTVKHLEKIDRNGNTYLYLVDTENNIYYAKYVDVIKMVLVSEGDKITIKTDGNQFRFPE